MTRRVSGDDPLSRPGPVGTAALAAALYVLCGLATGLLTPETTKGLAFWPAAGVAMAMCLWGGWAAAAGTLAGAAALVPLTAGAIAPHTGLIALAAGTAAALQAGIGAAMLRTQFGLPLRIGGWTAMALALFFAGPLACLIEPSIRTGALALVEGRPVDEVLIHWQRLWVANVLGVLMAGPLVLLHPWQAESQLLWRGERAPAFKLSGFLSIWAVLGLMTYAGTALSQSAHEANQVAFRDLAEENLRSLEHRIETYGQSLDGGAGLFHAMTDVDLPAWRRYVDTLDVGRTLSGISGIGFIEPVDDAGIPAFLARAAAQGVRSFGIHPETDRGEKFVIKYIEPVSDNRQAVGLDIAFEENRRSAAIEARDSGKPVITERIFLVQDSTRSAGFLLLRPLYRSGAALTDVRARREAFLGWVYAPFIGPRFMRNLTAAQGETLHLSVFDGRQADPAKLIYSSGPDAADAAPLYSVTETISIMEKAWTIRWDSTPRFEEAVRRHEPVLLHLSGFAVTALLGAMMIGSRRREEAAEDRVAAQSRDLAAQEAEMRSVVETAAVGILLIDGRGEVLSCNGAAAGIFGEGRQDLEGCSIYQLVPDVTPTMLRIREASGSGAVPIIGRTDRGQRARTLEIHVNQWSGRDAEPRLTMILRDVTDEHRVAQELQTLEERWDTALQGAGIGVFDHDLRRRRFTVSETWRTLLGFSASDQVGRDAWLLLVHPDDLELIDEAERRCLEGSCRRTVVEYRCRSTRPGWSWMRCDMIVAERDDDGNATRIVGTQIDVTEFKAASEALAISEAHFRTAAENAPIGKSMEAIDGSWREVNAALCSFLDYPREELEAIALERLVHRDDLGRLRDLRAGLVAGEMETTRAECQFLRRNGSVAWGLLCQSLARDANGDPDYLISQIQDIDEQKRVQRMKDEFVSTVSHELRTPLTSIRGSLGLMSGLGDDTVSEKGRRLLDIALSNCDRVIVLINDILDLEKLASGEIRFRLERHDVGEVTRQAVEANHGYAADAGVTLTLAKPVPECYARIDADRLQQVLANLLSNASKFSPTGGEVRVSVVSDDDLIRVSVADDGPGIPEEFRDRVFERFAQADSSSTRAEGGTGLGLHISREIVRQMGGTIGFDSVPGQGATFRVELPLMSGVVDVGSASLPEEFAGDRPVILHVEDDRSFAELLALALKDTADVVSASTCADAARCLEKREFDLVIIDWELPDGHGRALLDNPQLVAAGTPVIGLSANELRAVSRRVAAQVVKSKATHTEIVTLVERTLKDGEALAG